MQDRRLREQNAHAAQGQRTEASRRTKGAGRLQSILLHLEKRHLEKRHRPRRRQTTHEDDHTKTGADAVFHRQSNHRTRGHPRQGDAHPQIRPNSAANGQ